MVQDPRRARVRALAKVNLSLEVLNKRPDGYHNLRTIFQTISLSDTIDIEFVRAKKTAVSLESSVEIPDNLAVRAGTLVLESAKVNGFVRMRLRKRIPMGGGLGGGSADAAAVLLALPALTGSVLPLETLQELGCSLGSDVPFFLLGGTAVGLGRGTELYPLDSEPKGAVVVVFPGVHVSTAEAYGALARSLTSPDLSPKINSSQALAAALSSDLSTLSWGRFCSNDFETAVFRRYPELKAIKAKLMQAGASPAMMTGSGSALFGIFEDKQTAGQALRKFAVGHAFLVSLVSRKRYRAMWQRQLSEHIKPNTWPPQSRYAR